MCGNELARKKPHRDEKEWDTEGKRRTKKGMGCSEGESGVSVENTKLLSDGEQMSDCHCACIFLSNTGMGRRAVTGHLVAVTIKRDRHFCQISRQQINDLNFKTRPTSSR